MKFRHEQYFKSAEDAFVVVNYKDIAFWVLHMVEYQTFLTLISPSTPLFLPPCPPKGGLTHLAFKVPLSRGRYF
jgi:hypothetical protein